MVTLKCKMCGGSLESISGNSTTQCEYCGTIQTVPSLDNEKKMNLFARANRLRFACEFDKAAGIYESIVVDFPEEAEAYWGLMLCKYGIEYVDDPNTGKKIPTCHRSSFESVMDDDNFEQVMENADPIARGVYRDEAKQIENLRKEIIEVSNKEEPYDIFICYKETTEDGDRTIDSVIAQDVYDTLTEKGYRVFFSRVTLEDKLGQEYEPYIFAALNSAKVMLAFGTMYEYYNAVWVKNEWSRFLQLIAKGEKKTLIPCFKGIDAYDMPKEFAKLQAQDMSKVGAIQDLVRGIDKLLERKNQHIKSDTHIVEQSIQKQVDATVSLGIMALNTKDYKSAIDFFNEVLRNVPDHIGAYLGLLRATSLKDKAKPYIQMIKTFSEDSIIEYVKNHMDIVGDVHCDDNLLTRSIYYLEAESLAIKLLQVGITGNAVDALYYAINELQSTKLTQALLEHGADPNQTYFWSNNREGFSYCDETYSLLYLAISNVKSFELSKLLIDAGADTNFVYVKRANYNKSLDGSWSLLNVAVRNNSYELAEYLLQHGADPDVGREWVKWYDDGDEMPIWRSLSQTFSNLSETIWNTKDIKMLELLLKYKADPNKIDKRKLYTEKGEYKRVVPEGYAAATALTDAILYANNLEMVNMLLKYSADPNTIYRYETIGWGNKYHDSSCANAPMLALAIDSKNEDIVKSLIDKGANFATTVRYDEFYHYDGKYSLDSFPLAQLSFGNNLSNSMETLIKKFGWSGSKKGLFKKEHRIWYRY